jgi:glycosyltransferase involved in cell wall biosynthesis
MRVLVLSSVYPTAAMPLRGLFVRERTRHLAASCEVQVVAPIPWFPGNRWLRGVSRASATPLEQPDGFPVFHPRFLSVPRYAKSADGLLYFLSLAPFVARLRRRFAFELIDAHFAYPDGFAATLLARLFRVPVSVTLRGTEVPFSRSRLRRAQIRFVLRRAERVLTVSDSLARLARDLGAPAARVRVIPNGIDRARFQPGPRDEARRQLGLSPDRRIIVSVGGLTERKGHHRVLAAMQALVGDRPDLLLAIVGGGSSEGDVGPALRRQISALELDRHVLLAGPQPPERVPLWLQAADVFCLATANEGRPNAVLEALACGLPVVTTDVGGIAEVVRPGIDGLVVPFGDHLALTRALGEALDRSWDRDVICAHGSGRTWERAAQEVLAELAGAQAEHAGQAPRAAAGAGLGGLR